MCPLVASRVVPADELAELGLVDERALVVLCEHLLAHWVLVPLHRLHGGGGRLVY